MRDRIINSLGQRRGVKPGDPEFQRLFLARLSDMQKQSEIPAARRIALRTWSRHNKTYGCGQTKSRRKLHLSNNEGVLKNVEPLSVCGRPTNVGKRGDLALLEHAKNAGEDYTCPGANSNKLLLLQGQNTYGQTGNNLNEL